MGAYDPLKDYLATCDATDIVLSFEKIDSILHPGHLPKEAKDYRKWWENTRRNPQAVSWIDAGWRVLSVDINHREVAFTRDS
jgi:hypothetical protein